MRSFIARVFLGRTPAQVAGRKAARAWMKIQNQLDEDVEILTGRTLLAHAQSEARQWLRSTYKYDKHGYWDDEEERNPERKRHEEFLQYVEAFISVFPPMRKGYPKEGDGYGY